MVQKNTTAAELDSTSESFRERVARHLEGSGVESNWSSIVGEPPADDGPKPCGDCDGLGFVVLPAARQAVFAERIANLRAEAHAAAAAGKLDVEHKLQTKIRDEQWELNRESVCQTCGGSCYAPDDDNIGTGAVPHDSMFTTVTCPRCRGSDRRSHPKLMTRWHGSSVGTGCASPEHGGCGGASYLQPITARPMTKGGGEGGHAEDLEEFEINITHRATCAHSHGDPNDLIAEAMDEDPRLAAALVAYLGVHGDKWAKDPSGWGRRFAVWPFVTAGERMVAEAPATSRTTTSDAWYDRNLAIIEAERRTEEAAEDGKGDPRRRMLIKRADQESRWLAKRIEQLVQKHEAA